MTIPLCKDCKHLIGRRTALEQAETWRCGHPSNVASREVDALTGEEKTKFRIMGGWCRKQREASPQEWGFCGPEGKLFEAYVPPEPVVTVIFHRPKPTPIAADDLLNELTGGPKP